MVALELTGNVHRNVQSIIQMVEDDIKGYCSIAHSTSHINKMQVLKNRFKDLHLH